MQEGEASENQDRLTCLSSCPPQFKANLEKTKQALEGENIEMQKELKLLQGAKLESEQRRKKLEGQVQELQLRAAESERAKAELTERLVKLQVNVSRCFLLSQTLELALLSVAYM